MDTLARLDSQRALEDQAFASCRQTPTDERLYRENIEKIRHARDAILGAARRGVIERIIKGPWIGFAYTTPDSDLSPIPSKHWHFLSLDWHRAQAEGHGLSYFGIRFFDTEQIERAGELLPKRWANALELFAFVYGVKQSTEPTTREAPPAEAYRTGTRGRPGSVYLAVDEFKRRAQHGVAAPSVVAEARELQKWLRVTHPNVQTPTVKAIRNRIAALHRAYRERGPK